MAGDLIEEIWGKKEKPSIGKDNKSPHYRIKSYRDTADNSGYYGSPSKQIRTMARDLFDYLPENPQSRGSIDFDGSYKVSSEAGDITSNN